MQVSVVVPTLNGREEVAACLDALARVAPDAEVVVVNGPSADGTTGMLRERDDVDRQVQIADRSLAVALNAGIDHATGDVVALLDRSLAIQDGWYDALVATLEDADVVTGPTQEELLGGTTAAERETVGRAGRTVTRLNPGNAAFRRSVLDELDGVDEYLATGPIDDLAHRVAAADRPVAWAPEMAARREYEADGGTETMVWHRDYRARAYTEVKNYGLRPHVVGRLGAAAVGDAVAALRDVIGGKARPSRWLSTGRSVLGDIGVGCKDGLLARRRDAPPRRNPNGRSMRTDRAVDVYE